MPWGLGIAGTRGHGDTDRRVRKVSAGWAGPGRGLGGATGWAGLWQGGISGCQVSPSGRLGPLPDPAGGGAHGSPFEVPHHSWGPPRLPPHCAPRDPPPAPQEPRWVQPRAQGPPGAAAGAGAPPGAEEAPGAGTRVGAAVGAGGGGGRGGSGGLNPFPAGTPPATSLESGRGNVGAVPSPNRAAWGAGDLVSLPRAAGKHLGGWHPALCSGETEARSSAGRAGGLQPQVATAMGGGTMWGPNPSVTGWGGCSPVSWER